MLPPLAYSAELIVAPDCRQLKSKGSSAMKPSDFVRSVFSSYSNYIVKEVFPRMKPGSRIYVTAVTPPVVEDHCKPPASATQRRRKR